MYLPLQANAGSERTLRLPAVVRGQVGTRLAWLAHTTSRVEMDT